MGAPFRELEGNHLARKGLQGPYDGHFTRRRHHQHDKTTAARAGYLSGDGPSGKRRIESLLNDKGITDVDPEIKEELKTDMKNRLLDQINRAAIMQLSEEKAAELADLVDNPDFTNEKMTEFLQNSGVNLTEVALDTMLKFRGFYLEGE